MRRHERFGVCEAGVGDAHDSEEGLALPEGAVMTNVFVPGREKLVQSSSVGGQRRSGPSSRHWYGKSRRDEGFEPTSTTRSTVGR